MSKLKFPDVDELMEKHIERVRDYETSVITGRCMELDIPIPSDELLGEYRFNPFILITDHNFNKYLYFNDGTKSGKFVVGFVTHQEMHPTKLDFSMYTSVITEEPQHLKL
jgi:hypothetical protein